MTVARYKALTAFVGLVALVGGVPLACGGDEQTMPMVADDAGNRVDAPVPPRDGAGADVAAGEDAAPDAAPMPETCSPDGFCWMNPLPTGNAMHAVWRGPGGEVWSVGEAGTAVRWSKGSPTVFATGTAKSLRGVWGATSSDVWAVGDDGVMVHFDGAKWTPSTRGTAALWAVAGAGASDVWAVGDSGAAYHFDGATWSDAADVPAGSYSGVQVLAGGDVLVVGSNGLLAWRKAGTWSSLAPTGRTRPIRAVWAASPDRVWISDGALWTWDGTTWTEGSVGPVTALAGSSASDVWATTDSPTALLHWDGVAWKRFDTPFVLGHDAVAVAGPNEAWVVGDSPGLFGWSGSTWNRLGQGRTDWFGFHSVLPRSSTDVWIAGAGAVSHWDGSGFVDRPLPYGESNLLWSSGPNLWVAGNGGTVFLDVAGAWKDLDCTLDRGVSAFFGSGPNDLWAASYSRIAHWNGVAWTPVKMAPQSILGGWSVSATDIWLADGGLTRFDGTTFTTSLSPPLEFYSAVWAAAADDVWAVGDGGLIRRWRGSSWSDPVPGMPKADLHAVWGRSASDVWAVGERGTLLHFDGVAWSIKDSGTTRSLGSVRGLPSGEVWIVGGAGTTLRKR